MLEQVELARDREPVTPFDKAQAEQTQYRVVVGRAASP